MLILLKLTVLVLFESSTSEARPKKQCAVKGSSVRPIQSENTSISSRIASSIRVAQPSSSTGSTSSTSASISSVTNTISQPVDPAKCKCGYTLSAYSNAYFPFSHTSSFSSLPDGPVSASSLQELGWIMSDGWQSGGAAQDGTTPIGSISAFSAKDGALQLTVKGGQQKGGEVDVAEMTFDTPNGLTGGVFTMEVQIDKTPGTCQSIFTYKKDETKGDEQDIELMGYALFEKGDNGLSPGIQLNNWDPSGSGKNDPVSTPFTNDPTAGFHNMTIAWLPEETKYYYDGGALKNPTKYLIINHWTNGDKGWTQGPPTSDVVMKVKSITMFYKTPEQDGLPAGCTQADVCTV